MQNSFISSLPNNKRGHLIQAPCGSGKSTWIQTLSPQQRQVKYYDVDKQIIVRSGPEHVFLDGDEVLTNEGVKNRNYFWYQDGREAQKAQNSIRNVFGVYLSRGYNILYSGNPYLLETDVLVIPETTTRWQQLEKRHAEGGFGSSPDKFKLEEETYRKYASEHPEIPVFTSFDALLK